MGSVELQRLPREILNASSSIGDERKRPARERRYRLREILGRDVMSTNAGKSGLLAAGAR